MKHMDRTNKALIQWIYAPVICIHAPPPPHLRGWAEVMVFQFSEAWYKPCPVETSCWLQPCSYPRPKKQKISPG